MDLSIGEVTDGKPIELTSEDLDRIIRHLYESWKAREAQPYLS